MKNKLTIICFLLLATIGISAQNAAKAKQILNKATAKININKGAYATFTILSKGSRTSGTIYLKGNKFYTKTPKASMWFN